MNKKVEDWVNWVLYDELTAGKINAPKHLLGNHDYGEGQVITVYRPHAEKVVVTSATGKRAKACSVRIFQRNSTMVQSIVWRPHMRMVL